MLKNLYVGIDVSMKDFKAQYMDDLGIEAYQRQRFENNDPGFNSFIDSIIHISFQGLNRVVIGIESTSVYGWHLQMGLASSNRISKYEPQIYVFNPKMIKNFKKAYADLPKNDWIDAW